jgi:soluble lytic murein transglycosylase-like protein
MPSTAAILGVDPHDPMENLLGTTKYLRRLLDAWSKNPDAVSLALASYNAGPGAVRRHGGIPPYSETRNYVFFINYLRKEYDRQFHGPCP